MHFGQETASKSQLLNNEMQLLEINLHDHAWEDKVMDKNVVRNDVFVHFVEGRHIL